MGCDASERKKRIGETVLAKFRARFLENSVRRQKFGLGKTQVQFWSVAATLNCPVIVSFLANECGRKSGLNFAKDFC